MDITYHYPPDLLNLLIDTIPRLCRSKKDVLLFFKGAGAPTSMINDLAEKVMLDSQSITKYEIARTVLQRLNEEGEATLRQRREVLKRVVEFENFSSCWPNDQRVAKGLVADIREIVNIKDSFTRMKMEREQERNKSRMQREAELRKTAERNAELDAIKKELYGLFSPGEDPHKRGKALEGILNRLFRAEEILVHEAFSLVGVEGEGIVEQIDGVIEIEGEIYLVEMKWLKSPVDRSDISDHLVRVFFRGHARGIFISASDYTAPALTTAPEALQRALLILCNLEELIVLLERQENLKVFLKQKINAAIMQKNPLYHPLQ